MDDRIGGGLLLVSGFFAGRKMIDITNAGLPFELELEREWVGVAKNWLRGRTIGYWGSHAREYQRLETIIAQIEAKIIDELHRLNEECQMCGGLGYYLVSDEEIKCSCRFEERDEDFSTADKKEK